MSKKLDEINRELNALDWDPPLSPAPADARPAAEPRHDNEENLSRVDGVPSDRPLGSTASNNELIRPFQSCHCPAQHGENCPLTFDECDARTRDYVGMPWFGERLRRIYNGFVNESLNGVVCSIPDTGLNTPTYRHWCVSCQRRYMELKALVEMLDRPEAIDAVDPQACSTGKPSTRDKSSSSVSDRVRAEQAEARLARLVRDLEKLVELCESGTWAAEDYLASVTTLDEVRALITAAKQEPT